MNVVLSCKGGRKKKEGRERREKEGRKEGKAGVTKEKEVKEEARSKRTKDRTPKKKKRKAARPACCVRVTTNLQNWWQRTEQNTHKKIRLSHHPVPALVHCSVPVAKDAPGDCRFDSVESLHPSFHSFVRPSVHPSDRLPVVLPFRLPLSSPLFCCQSSHSSPWPLSPDPLAWPCPAAPSSRFVLPPPRRSPPQRPLPRMTWSPCPATRNTTPALAVFASTTAALSRTT